MGRSKFPGKPPKTVTRKRIKVLAWPEATQSDSITVAENIYYGLSLFNETFGDNEKEHPPFHGFSSKEAKLSASYIKTQQQDGKNSAKDSYENLPCSSSIDEDIVKNTKTSSSVKENHKIDVQENKDPIKNEKIETTSSVIVDKSDEKPSSPSTRANKSGKVEKFSNFIKTPVLKSVNNILDRHHRTRQLRNSTAKRLLQKAKSNNSNARGTPVQSTTDKSINVRKFVLPIRSAHSSRVIKPNKRFIEELEEKSTTEHSENDAKQTKKAKKGKEDENSLLKSNEKESRTKLKKLINQNSQSTGKCNEKSIAQTTSRQKINKLNSNDQPLASQYQKHNIINNNNNGIPAKVLPNDTINIPNSESSRIQTRSGALNNASTSQNPSQKVPENHEISMPTEETIESNNSLKNSKNSHDTNDISTNCKTDTDHFDSESSLSESGSEHGNNSEDEQSEWTGTKLSGGKVILRKARLKLDNKTLGGTEGPFSMANVQCVSNGSPNTGLTGTVKCGVCGAVRFYRFVKQARKFGIYSCESCRKFISKMIKRQACAKSTNNTLTCLQCHKGDGLCLVPPVVRSQQWNLMRCVYKARCPACWLKMCLKCYNIPAVLRTGLNAMLPPLMRDPLTISLPLCLDDNDLQNQKLIGCNMGWPNEDCLEKNLFKSAMNWNNMEIGQKSNYHSGGAGSLGGFLTKKTDKFDYPASVSPIKKRKKENRIKVRKKMKNPSVTPTTFNKSPTAVSTRQRVELKGPRVKHVCRSASVALGQPIATFPSPDCKDDVEVNKITPKAQKEGEKSDKKEEVTREKESHKSNQEGLICNINSIPQLQPKRGKNQNNLAVNFSVERSLPKQIVETLHTVSIDFWEQYDPAQVGAKGFALIGSELFHIPAICFLCGSAGREPLIHCQCCCEPYHIFCLEPSEWNACIQPNWCCPRCTVCQTCQLRSGTKLSCIRCRQSFHYSCFPKSGVSARLYSPDRPYVCQSCIKCKSCGSEGVNVYVGNLPLCSMCFKLRQRGNYCPLCQRCYNENDFDTKMMECNECSCWVHAHCEGLSDERYQILSYLPDTIEFTCRQCSSNPNSIWRNAIEAELKTGFIAVVKALSKNRKTCAALQWSPRKECLCRPLTTIRKLDFDEKFESTNKNGTINEDIDDSMTDKLTSESNCNFKGELNRFNFDLDEQPIDVPRRGLRRLRQKIHTKDCSGKMKNHSEINSKESTDQENSSDCNCSEQQIITRPSPTLLSVKQKVNGNEYGSLAQFHCDMEHVINRIGAPDLLEAYHNILKEIFPWFDTLSSSLEINLFSTPSKENQNGFDSPGMKLDNSILDAWKEEILRSPKSVTAKTGNVYSNINVEDARSCSLCKGLGDGQELKEGRLLYCGQNEWVHSNCALWSNEVFEEIDGSLQNVHSTISRGRLIRCSECGKKGASIGCCSRNCNNTFHYSCARNMNMLFNDDKTVFCSLHADDCSSKKIQNENDFCLKRPVYVELDRKKKKFAEPDKVKVMIGSLTVDCLGTISPEFSDGIEKIIPSGYKCSRLYWSTVNPLKIVRYYIRTYVQVYVPEVSTDLENNVTIDHSKEQQIEEELRIQKMEFLAVKQTLDALIDTVCNKEVDENLAEQNNTDLLPPELKEAIFEDLPHDLLDGISMQDIFPKMSIEDFLVMDLKNDAFSTELLKDEMLPTEVEELKLSENKASKTDSILDSNSQSDSWLEAKNSDLMDDIFDPKNQKQGKEIRRSKSEATGNVIVNGQRCQRSCSLTWSCKLDSTYNPTMKRRKVPRNSNSVKSNDAIMEQQDDRKSMFHDLRIPDSIMVTVGRTSTSNIISESVRELKYCVDDASSINCRLLPSKDETKDHKNLLWHSRQQPRIVQVDGPADASSASECSSPEYNLEERILPNCPSMPQLDGANDDTSQDNKLEAKEIKIQSDDAKDILKSRLQRIFEFSEIESRKKLTEQEISKNAFSLKIPQLDGADDISSDDECINSQINHEINQSIPEVITEELGDQPVKCKRCQCTYRTLDSYNRHLTNCDIMTTSDSDSETMDNKLASPDSTFSMSPQFASMSPSEGHTLLSEYPDMQVTSPLEASVPSPHPNMQIEPIAQAIITPQMHTHATVETVHQTVLTSNDMIVQTQYTRTTTTLPNSSVVPSENGVQITEIPSSDSNDLNPMNPSTETITNFSPPIPTQPSVKAPKVKSPRAPKPRTKTVRAPVVRNSGQSSIRCQAMQNNPQMIQLQQSQRQAATAPTVILQQVAPQSLMSAYVETLQQQSGQNLQYIAAIGGQHEAAFKPQFIATNQLVPGSYIQTTPDNLLALQNGGISVLPSVQLAQPQPTVLGTIIQQQPSAIQCGVISSEQLVLSSTPTLEMFTDSTGSMFVSSQPMYYGLETIVSNTVMSSSQFVAGTVPQVLASSYQTTTQVFQASKLMEPIVDVQAVSAMPNVPTVQAVQGVPGMAGSYVVVNQPASLTDTISTPQLSVSTNPEPNYTPVACTNLSSTITPTQSIESVRTSVGPILESSVRPIHNLETTSSIRPILDESIQNFETSIVDINNSLKQMPTIPRVAVRPNPMNPSENDPWKITEPILANEQPINNSIRPYFDSKHVSQNTSMIKSSISSKIPPLHNHCTHRNIVNKCNDVNSVHSNYSSSLTNNNSNCNNLTLNNSPVISNPSAQNKIMTFNTRPMNRVLPMQAVTPKLESIKQNQKSDIVEEPTKPEIKSIETEKIDLPPKEISPIIKPEIKLKINNLEMIVDATGENFKLLEEFEENDKQIFKENFRENLKENNIISLKENVKKNINENIKETFTDNIKESLKENVKEFANDTLIKENLNENLKETIKENTRETIKEIKDNVRESIKEIKEYVRENIKEMKGTIKEIAKVNMKEIAKENIRENIKENVKIKENIKREKDNVKEKKDKNESMKENLKNKSDIEPKEKSPSSLKIVLQKQLQDGSYKITHNLTTTNQKKSIPQPQNQLQLLPIKTFTLKTNALSEKTVSTNNNLNFVKIKSPPIAVKKPRLASKNAVKNSKQQPPPPTIVQQKKKLTVPSLMYEIKSQDGFTHTASSMSEVWETVFQAVQNARKAHNLPPLPHNPLTENLGLENNATVYLVEQLPGVNRCTKYKPKFHNLTPPKPGEGDGDLLTECINGAARAEPFKERKVHDVFSWLASRHRQQPKLIAITENESRRAASTNLPMAMRFRILKETSKESVGVYHSHIHGRGLFCLRDIEAGEMVIEYAGEVIRASLTDKREKYYDSKNIGCYMFKIDDHLVVDATMKGNAARFINHSCEPNCYSRVVDILGKKHILIFALRRIVQGEELTYDYKFPFEDIKIPCTCGSRRCRKYLN